MIPVYAEMRRRLAGLTLRDERRLRRRLDQIARTADADSDSDARRQAFDRLAAEVAVAETRVERRRAAVPVISYPAQLPVSERKDEILAAIRDNQVVVVAGETGSGKTTQIPKICLELGRGVRGLIGHTQPRRIAARTVADRIAEELGTQLGEIVGYKVRFTDSVGDETLVKLMTDGILLAELHSDRSLLRYDTLIIDEAHERSLNIDFILGYLNQLLPRRPDLKVVITSATIDPERFSRHFGGAPVVEVSGRTYPVQIRYRPLVAAVGAPGTGGGDAADTDHAGDAEGAPGDGAPRDVRRDIDVEGSEGDRDQTQAICDAVLELRGEAPGDVLVFLSGEREIRDTADALNRLDLPMTEILPLYARLSAADQHRVFQPHTGRRVVLATNVAETSLTVPGISYVVDPGTARISRYSRRTKMQRLPIEPISQASARQRAGRCGRTSDGICIRLYSEDDFLGRPEFTDPEILRTNLASVILQMAALGLGDLEHFPFVDPPDRRTVNDGVALLHELGAFETEPRAGQPRAGEPRAGAAQVGEGRGRRLTAVGRRLAQLPLDPRLGRMVLEAEGNGALAEVMVVASGLAIMDPRERPADAEQAADASHRRFADPTSDFLGYLKMWEYLREQQRELSSSQFRRRCKAEYLNARRIREWQDVHAQLRSVVKDLGMVVNDVPASPQAVHTSLLAGLLSHVGLFDPEKRDYLGARGARFSIFPGSTLFKKPPRWVTAAEMVETSRAWGRVVAKIEPEWVEPLAGHLVHRTYSEPHWSSKQGAVMAYERVTLYGVPLVTARRVNYSRIDPALCREMFIRHALVEGDWRTHHRFFHTNRELLADVDELEERARRRDIRVDDETLFDFYDERLPADAVSARHFDSWWKKARRETPDLFDFSTSMLVNPNAAGVVVENYPDVWRQGELEFALSYQFEPGSAADGVTVSIPLAVLNQVSPDGFDWGVPGLREDLVTALIRTLPKAVRRSFVPAPNYARTVLGRVSPDDGALLSVLTRELRRLGGAGLDRADWQLDKVPPHLRMTFRVLGDDGGILAEGKDLDALRDSLAPKVRQAVAAVTVGVERAGVRRWDMGTLPQVVEQRRPGSVAAVKAFPALVDPAGSAMSLGRVAGSGSGSSAGSGSGSRLGSGSSTGSGAGSGSDAGVEVRVFGTEAEARHAMWSGTRRLLLLEVPSPVKGVVSRLSTRSKLTLSANPHGGVAALLDDCVTCAADKLLVDGGGPAWDEAGHARLVAAVRAGLPETTSQVLRLAEAVLGAAAELRRDLDGVDKPGWKASVADLRTQLAGLVYPGFVTETGYSQLGELPRYLAAARRRVDKLPHDAGRDAERTRVVADVQAAYDELRDALPPAARSDADVRRIRWMIEELRVSLFAQNLRTAYPISAERIYRAIDDRTP